MEKLDLRKQYKHLYAPSPKKVEVIDVPALNFVMIDGQIEAGQGPGTSPGFQEAVGALYGAAYTLKFMSKQRAENPIDYKVMALEGLWSTESGTFQWGRREPWLYTLLMLQPDHIEQGMLTEAVARTREKRPNPALDRVRLERWREGPSIQVMHIGPYSEEPRTLEMIEEFAREHEMEMHGRHHEIYLGDPRTAKPENLKTILRHPVRIPA
jgi:hypothetical protein